MITCPIPFHCWKLMMLWNNHSVSYFKTSTPLYLLIIADFHNLFLPEIQKHADCTRKPKYWLEFTKELKNIKKLVFHGKKLFCKHPYVFCILHDCHWGCGDFDETKERWPTKMRSGLVVYQSFHSAHKGAVTWLNGNSFSTCHVWERVHFRLYCCHCWLHDVYRRDTSVKSVKSVCFSFVYPKYFRYLRKTNTIMFTIPPPSNVPLFTSLVPLSLKLAYLAILFILYLMHTASFVHLMKNTCK